MKPMVFIAPLAAAMALGGCMGESALVDTRFVGVSSGTADVRLEQERNFSVSRPAVGRVAWARGFEGDGTVVYASGIEDGATVGAPVTFGTASYDTDYSYSYTTTIRRVDLGDTIETTFFPYGQNGTTTLTADFDQGSLSGGDSNLQVNGTISGTALSGGVTVATGTSTQDGVLTGQIGSTGVIGAFHGNNGETTAIAGGFVGERN